MTPPVTTEPACSRPKITDFSPCIPQETLILKESVKPPGRVLGGRTKSFSLACSRMAWIAAHVFRPRACLPCVSCSQQCRVKAKQMQSVRTRDLQFSLHGHKDKQWEQDQAGWSTGEQDPFLIRNGLMIHFSAVIKLAWLVTRVFAVPNIVKPGRLTCCQFDLFSLNILDRYFNLLL